MGSENLVVVRLLQIGAKELTVIYIYNFFLGGDKVVGLVGGGSVINGAYSV